MTTSGELIRLHGQHRTRKNLLCAECLRELADPDIPVSEDARIGREAAE